MPRFSVVVLGTFVLAACGGGGGGGTGPTPNTIVVNAGNNQVAPAGTALPESLAVIVRDQSGTALANVNVTFSVTAGGGSVSPTTRATNASGIAKTRLTLGPNAGTHSVNAVAGSLAPATFNAVAQINGAVNIANTTTGPLTDTVGATKAESLTVLVTDQNTTPIPGVTVNWASVGGSVSASSVPTSAAGLSKVRFIYGNTAGNQTATASVTGLVGSPVTITLNGTAGTAVAIAKTSGDGGTANVGSQVTYTVQSRDSHGNPKGGVMIDWAATSGGGSISPLQNTTSVTTGNASATRTLSSTAGSHTATATAASLPSSPSVTFTTTAAVVSTVLVEDNSFNPSSITITAGTTVTWDWVGSNLHNVTFSTAGSPSNITNRTSGSVQRSFPDAGTFSYSCTNHGGMNGSVTVN